MPKKSRKIGRIGVRKSDVPKPVKKERNSNKANTTKGNKPGSRQQSSKEAKSTARKTKLDNRLGSKAPINLNKYKDGATLKTSNNHIAEKVVYKTPHDELEAIENDAELDALLAKQDEQTLNRSEQAYVDKMTRRYRELCKLSGIEVDEYTTEDKQENPQEVDPFANLDAIKLDDYKD